MPINYPGIKFDANGVCSHCHKYDKLWGDWVRDPAVRQEAERKLKTFEESEQNYKNEIAGLRIKSDDFSTLNETITTLQDQNSILEKELLTTQIELKAKSEIFEKLQASLK